MGLAPTTVLKARRPMAKAAGIRKTGGCTTTSFACTVGLGKGPTISLRVELVQSWLAAIATGKLTVQAVTGMWETLNEEITGAGIPWNQVKGPTGALIATRYDIGWQPDEPPPEAPG